MNRIDGHEMELVFECAHAHIEQVIHAQIAGICKDCGLKFDHKARLIRAEPIS